MTLSRVVASVLVGVCIAINTRQSLGGLLEKCLLPVEPGNCTEHIQRWFFNNRTGLCQPFIYTGCNGNNNSFNSTAYCYHACNVSADGFHAYSIAEVSRKIKDSQTDKKSGVEITTVPTDFEQQELRRAAAAANQGIESTEEASLNGNERSRKERRPVNGANQNRRKRSTLRQYENNDEFADRYIKSRNHVVDKLLSTIDRLQRKLATIQNHDMRRRNHRKWSEIGQRNDFSRRRYGRLERNNYDDRQNAPTLDTGRRSGLTDLLNIGLDDNEKKNVGNGDDEDDEIEVVGERIKEIISDPAYVFSYRNITDDDMASLQEVTAQSQVETMRMLEKEEANEAGPGAPRQQLETTAGEETETKNENKPIRLDASRREQE